MAERWLAIASLVLIAACGPREITYDDVEAMTEEEKVTACREAWDLRNKPTGPCDSIEEFDFRKLCIRRVRRENGIGLVNYVILDCTRVKFFEEPR